MGIQNYQTFKSIKLDSRFRGNDIKINELIRLDIIKKKFKLFEHNLENFIKQTFILPITHIETGLKIYLVFGITMYEENFYNRAIDFDVLGNKVKLCSIEDLIIQKIIAYRGSDQQDIEFLTRKYKNKIDWSYIENMLNEFENLLDYRDLIPRFENLRKK